MNESDSQHLSKVRNQTNFFFQCQVSVILGNNPIWDQFSELLVASREKR